MIMDSVVLPWKVQYTRPLPGSNCFVAKYSEYLLKRSRLKNMSTSLSHDKTRFRKQSLGYSATEASMTSCFGYSEGRMFLKIGLISDNIFCIL